MRIDIHCSCCDFKRPRSYAGLPYPYFRPTPSARLLGTIPLIRILWSLLYCLKSYPWYFCFKAWFHLTRSEIWSSFQRDELLRLKWVGNTTRQLTALPPPPNKKGREPQVSRGQFGVHLLILHFQMHQIFSIYIAFPNCPKIIETFTQNSKTLVDF